MKGVVLAGGLGSRLAPLTNVTNKHLLPIYTKPMIFYPIETLANAGIKEIMVVVSGPFAGDFIRILKNGHEFGLDKLEYAYQEKPDGGIADALSLAETFAEGEKIAVVLGDNTTDADISKEVKDFEEGRINAHLFLKEVPDPHRFGVAKFDAGGWLTGITEKPSSPASNFAVTGLYLYDSNVFKFIRQCIPSKRGELEVTDVNNFYINDPDMVLGFSELNGFWQDAGTVDNLYLANKYWYEKFHGVDDGSEED